MENIKVLIADGIGDITIKLQSMLIWEHGFECVGRAINEEETINMIKKWVPDMVIIDLCSFKLDGLHVIEKVDRDADILYMPTFLAAVSKEQERLIEYTFTQKRYQYLKKQVFQPDIEGRYIGTRKMMESIDTALENQDRTTEYSPSQIMFVIKKPFDANRTFFYIKYVAGKIREEKRRLQCFFLSNDSKVMMEWKLEKDTTRVLQEIGIPAHIKGFRYLRDAIKMTIKDPQVVDLVSKRIYPVIAKKYNTQIVSVERAIRLTIELAWSRGRADIIYGIFGYCMEQECRKPTNSEFIAVLADWIHRKMQIIKYEE